MKINISITDDSGEKYEGVFNLSSSDGKALTQKSESPTDENNNYEGLRGGIRFLINNKFLKELRTAKDIHNELKKEGYYYSIKSVDADLRKYFFSQTKILSRIKENGKWKYIVRK